MVCTYQALESLYSGSSCSLPGRAWTHRELRKKSWEDLHCLWWVCCKERNRLATEKVERKRVKAGLGDLEGAAREKEVSVAARGRYYMER